LPNGPDAGTEPAAADPKPGLLLTTEVTIAEAPKDESDHVHPAQGGMGGMDM